MGQRLGRLWERVQGKPHLRKICDKTFDQTNNARGQLKLNDLHNAVLLVFNDVNKFFPGAHKEPPSTQVVAATVEQLRGEKQEEINREQFYELILKWAWKDLRLFVLNKFLLALLAAPAMAEITKGAAGHVPSIRNVVKKIPTPIFISACTVGLVLIQDFSVSVD